MPLVHRSKDISGVIDVSNTFFLTSDNPISKRRSIVIDLCSNLNFSLLEPSRDKKDDLFESWDEEDKTGNDESSKSNINETCDVSSNMDRTRSGRKCLDIIGALDSSSYSNSLVTVGDVKTKEEMRRILALLDEEYSNISYNSKNFAGWEYPRAGPRGDLFHGRGRSASVSLPPIPTLKEKEKVTINVEIEGLADLLQLIRDYPLIDNVEYNINMAAIHKIKGPLRDLDKMIGMAALKDNIVDQIIYYVQNFHKMGRSHGDFMHTVIYGPPGTGKTEVAKIIGDVFSKLGVLPRGTFRKATRSDLVAGYLGQTALKTREVIKDCLGGVLFIDEAYALGNAEKRDSFAKECIDTLCEALSDHKDNIMVIIAGYETELKQCFFDYNQGLESRFTWRFKTDNYTCAELRNIFLKKVTDAGWSISPDTDITESWFENNMDYFKYYGRDMETLFAKTKICHSRRVFCKSKEDKTKITVKDLEKGLALYLANDEVKKRADDGYKAIQHMYV